MRTPLSNSPYTGLGKKTRSGKFKFLMAALVFACVPLVLSTYAASVTVGTGSLEFGQGTQQATSCDDTVYIAMNEEWHPDPTEEDPSFGFFRVRALTVSNVNLETCAGKILRVRMIDESSNEITLGPVAEAQVIQVVIPETPVTENIQDADILSLAYVSAIGDALSIPVIAQVKLNIQGTSLYNGSDLSLQNADVTFYFDPNAQTVNIKGKDVKRTTVETLENPL